MIQAAGLDWEVDMRPARGAIVDKKGEANRYEIIRLPESGKPEDEILFGVVSNRYEPLQNTEAFAFFDPIVAEGKAYFETAGALGQGERVWVMAKMPGAFEVVAGDVCDKYLLLSNSHNGTGSVIVKFTSVRVVCQNTLMLAMEDGQRAYRVRHSKVMSDRLNDLSDLIATAQNVYLSAETLFKAMAQVQVTSKLLASYLEEIFPRTAKQKKENTLPPKWSHVAEVFETCDDLQLKGVRGTLWGAYNAVTRFEDYRELRGEESADDRLSRTWFGSSADIKLTALQAASRMVGRKI